MVDGFMELDRNKHKLGISGTNEDQWRVVENNRHKQSILERNYTKLPGSQSPSIVGVIPGDITSSSSSVGLTSLSRGTDP